MVKLLVTSIPDASAIPGATRCDFSCPCMVDLRQLESCSVAESYINLRK